MALPELYESRIRSDTRNVVESTQIPDPSHISIREYILQTTRATKAMEEEELRVKWQLLEEATKKIVEETRERTKKIQDELPEGVRKMWGDAHLGFLEKIILAADPINGEAVAKFIIQGVPTVGTFPQTSLFKNPKSEAWLGEIIVKIGSI